MFPEASRFGIRNRTSPPIHSFVRHPIVQHGDCFAGGSVYSRKMSDKRRSITGYISPSEIGSARSHRLTEEVTVAHC